MRIGFYNFAFATVAASIAVGANADDAAGRRIEIVRSGSAMSESRTDSYGYNARGEVTSATKQGGQPPSADTLEYAYQYDDIGNRITSTDLGTNRTYTANSLNQYSAITTSDFGLQTSSFEPQFDDDGNQTLIKTATGIWSVSYNGENRPVLWTRASDGATVSMAFDRMGRRVRCPRDGGDERAAAHAKPLRGGGLPDDAHLAANADGDALGLPAAVDLHALAPDAALHVHGLTPRFRVGRSPASVFV